MRASGNGNPKICVQNLLQLLRGENPYERIKGIDPRLIDQPAQSAGPQIQQDAEWLIETYESRVRVNEIRLEPEQNAHGGFIITADVTEI